MTETISLILRTFDKYNKIHLSHLTEIHGARTNTGTGMTSKIASLHVMIYHLCGHVAHFVNICVVF